jgi:hypothetical protein
METVVDVRRELVQAFKTAKMSSPGTRTSYIARDKEQDHKVEVFIHQLDEAGFFRRTIPNNTLNVRDRDYLILFTKGEYEVLYCARTYSGWSAIYGINYKGQRLL